ncbi:hypothetical protein ACIP9G_21735 [Lysinibacillus sp. NPDC093197]|uniref:hypothetical protein n=1 Tax=Lysinibacillus sp. NPDC093197 TaxID=3364132 RepID=UPI0038198F93
MNWDNFLSDVYKSCDQILSIEEISKILNISNYEKDNPISQGKRLIIKRLKLSGKKITGEVIDYDKNFFTGVNVIFADNNKGKSSIFKIIKFALTGDKSSVKKDVYDWIDTILFEFDLNNTTYSVYINLTNTRIRSGLYRSSIDSLIINENGYIELEDILINFEANTETAFKDKMQNFFFEQFSYYNLTWTSSTKKSLELIENNTSWKTYYKSIYLESKDYNVLFLNSEFGSQNKKVLEMILGLKYTALINSWNKQSDYLQNSINKKLFIEKVQDGNNQEKNELVTELEKLNIKISEMQEQRKTTFKKTLNIENYKIQSLKLFNLAKEITALNNQVGQLQKEKLQIEKRITNLTEELNFGFFFSNLDIKKCPRCEHEIKPSREISEKTNHKCMLCEDPLDPKNEEDEEILTSKINELSENLAKISAGIERLMENIIQKTEAKIHLESSLNKHEQEVQDYSFEDKQIDQLSKLIEKRIEIEHKLVKKNTENPDATFEILDHKLKVINCAINLLNKLRYKESDNILKSLCSLISSQLIRFGQKNIDQVTIKDNLEIIFIQNGKENKFSELNEGEQLRAKIAVVLSLILLDVKYSVGRHPRILIIDSPGKEEVISNDLISLASIFKEIEDEYKNDLQIIIGTALEELKNASVDYKIDAKDEGKTIF